MRALETKCVVKKKRERERERERMSSGVASSTGRGKQIQRVGDGNDDDEFTESERRERRQRSGSSGSAGAGAGDGDGVVVVAARVVRTHPRKVATVFLWMLGLFCMFFAPAPIRITPAMEAKYQQKMDAVANLSGSFIKTSAELDKLGAELSQAQTWWWYFKSEDRKKVNEIRERMEPFEKELDHLHKERYRLESEARNELGLWSEAGLRETKDVFWSSYNRGKRQAKVGIIWDLVWEMFRSDNYEDSVNFLFRIIWILVSNAVMFLFAATIAFMFRVVPVIRSFNPGLLSGILFYLLALLAALSTIGTIVSLVVGAGVGSSLVVAKNAQYLPQSNRRRYVRHQRRTHQD